MKLLKWIGIFVFAFVVSFLLLRTFSQEVFKATASAHMFGYTTPEIPIYHYIAGAFALGLSIGTLIAVYNFIAGRMAIHTKSKRIHELEDECKTLQSRAAAMEKSEPPADTPSRREEYAENHSGPEEKDSEENASQDDATGSFLG